jgi:hypothetical protein
VQQAEESAAAHTHAAGGSPGRADKAWTQQLPPAHALLLALPLLIPGQQSTWPTADTASTAIQLLLLLLQLVGLRTLQGLLKPSACLLHLPIHAPAELLLMAVKKATLLT